MRNTERTPRGQIAQKNRSAGSTLGISLDELEIFVSAVRLKSLKEVCRQLSLQPASVSKRMQKLERKVGTKLLTRSVQGVHPTPEGLALYKTSEKILAWVPDLAVRNQQERTGTQIEKICSIGSISFICSNLLAPCLGRWGTQRKDTRYRIIEFSENELVSHGLKGAFELAVHIGPLDWTRVWHTQSLGHLRWALYGRSGHPLGAQSSQRQVLQFPFIVPTGWTDQGFIAGEDYCPVGVPFRIAGNEAATAETAIQIIQSTDHLVYIPEIMARKSVQSRLIQEIVVQDWPKTTQEIFISAHSTQVSKPMLTMVRDDLRKTIKGR